MKKKKRKNQKALEIIFSFILLFLLWVCANFNQEEFKPRETPVDESQLQIYFLDVGQADSILVCQQGKTMLVDAGNNADGKKIVEFLQELGITQLDYLVGTHPHEDHIGGLDDIIDAFPIGTIYMPKQSATTKTFEEVLDAIQAKSYSVVSPAVGTVFSLGNARCEIMAKGDNVEEANLASLVIEITYGTQTFLLTGDMEAKMEAERTWHDIDVLKVAHHGSSTSSTEEFLAQTKPEVAIISCGKDNDYGHPHSEVIERLQAISCEIYRTDEWGTIEVTSDGTTNQVTALEVSCDGDR